LKVVEREKRFEGRLLGFEEEDCAVSEVEVDEVLGLVRDEGAEVATYDAVPCWTSAIIEL